jgi:hypothetical protein
MKPLKITMLGVWQFGHNWVVETAWTATVQVGHTKKRAGHLIAQPSFFVYASSYCSKSWSPQEIFSSSG